ncbi:MAG: hypothetical protein JW768_08120 [Chitinispirillaceae bacterium]|nr:hypothetical protein [Chitinispirillaceae bacterium]
MHRVIIVAVVAIIGLLPSALAEDQESANPTFLFWGRLTMGQVVSTWTNDSYDFFFEKEWLKGYDAGVKLTRRIAPHTIGRINGGFGVIYAARRLSMMAASTELTAKKTVPYLLDASLVSTFGMLDDRDTLLAEAGYFPFKYNPQSTSLGEYLFRTGTYPGVLVSGFEHSIDRPKVCGVHLSWIMNAAGRLTQDFLLTTEMDFFPMHDLNFTYIAAYTPHPFIDFGAGVEFARFLPVDERKTTPGKYGYLYNYRNPDERKWVGYVDTVANDTVIYTFSGIKPMARLTISPQSLYRISFLGKEDLKLYAEAVVLGVKNYAGWYENLEERIPVMFGMNWPTHQLLSYCIVPGVMGYLLEQKNDAKLTAAGMFGAGGVVLGIGSWLVDHFLQINTKPDLLAIEGEWYGSKYWNSQEYIWKAASPVPYTGYPTGPDIVTWDRKTNDDWRWSVYMSKRINTFLRISGQAASDHTPRNWYTPGPPSFVKYTELVPRSNDWYYMMRMTLYF